MATFLRHFSHVKCEGFDIPYTGTNTNIHTRHSLFFIYPLRPSERNEQLMGVSCIQCLQVSLVVASKCDVKVMCVLKVYNLDLINLAMNRSHNVWKITAINSGVSGPYIHSEQIRLVDCRVRFKD